MKFSQFSHESLRGERQFRKYWNLAVLLGICWYAITVPLYIALDIDSRGWSLALDMAWTIFFIIDIYLNFNTPYLTDGEWITDKSVIRKRYLRSWFAMDLAATIPFDMLLIVLSVSQPWILSATRLIRIFRVFRLFRLTDVVINLSTHGKESLVTDVVLDANAQMKITLLFFWGIIGLNGIACGWLLISPQYLVGNFVTDYIMGLYWTVTTLTTVGYGEITPVGDTARLYTMVVMVVGVVMYGLVIGNISTVMHNHKVDKIRQREKVVELAHFLKNYKIPKHLQVAIFNYYNHYVFEKSAKNSDLINELPLELQREINDYVNIFMLRDVPIFSNASQECLTFMVRCLKMRTLSPNEKIIHHGEVGDEMYFLSHGVVEVQAEDGTSIAKLRSGSFFGETALLKEMMRNATVKAVTFSDVYVLNKKDFIRGMESYPDFKDEVGRIVNERQDNV
jgi:hypothetical protein